MPQTPPAGNESGALAEIVLRLGGVPTTTSIHIGGRAILGRIVPGHEPVDVDLGQLPGGEHCSPRHACIWRTADNVWWIGDIGSYGGTFWRGSGQGGFIPVTAHQRLGDGDELALGNLHLQFRIFSSGSGKAALPSSQQAGLVTLPVVAATGMASVDPLRTEKLLCVAAMAMLLLVAPILFSTPTTRTNHTYTSPGMYMAQLQATDNNGVRATATRIISVDVPGHLPPAVTLIAEPLNGNAPLTVSFAARVESDSGGNIKRYDWDFDGDGKFELLNAPATQIRVFSKAGVSNVSVLVTDFTGAQNMATSRILANAPGGLESNTSRLTKDESESTTPTLKPDLRLASCRGDAPFTVGFDAAGSTDSDGRIVFYAWDFDGDGTYDTFSNSAIGYRVGAGMLSMALICGFLLASFIQRRVGLKRTCLAFTISWCVIVLAGFTFWFINGMLQGAYLYFPGVANSSPQLAFVVTLVSIVLFYWIISILKRDIYNMQHGL